MKYVIADIHGCYREYMALLEKIGFCEEDELYVLGDAMDRGPEPIKVIRDMMDRPNVFYILGNHDHMMLTVMEKLAVDVTEANLMDMPDDLFTGYFHWLQEGGDTTDAQFRALTHQQRRDVLDYLRDAPAYDMIEEKGKLFVLVHAGIRDFDPQKELEEYDPFAFLWERTDYGRRYFPSDRIFLVTGHTPTMLIREDEQPLVYEENGHIAIDCGCVFGGNLAAYCIETGKITYAASEKAEK